MSSQGERSDPPIFLYSLPWVSSLCVVSCFVRSVGGPFRLFLESATPSMRRQPRLTSRHNCFPHFRAHLPNGPTRETLVLYRFLRVRLCFPPRFLHGVRVFLTSWIDVILLLVVGDACRLYGLRELVFQFTSGQGNTLLPTNYGCRGRRSKGRARMRYPTGQQLQGRVTGEERLCLNYFFRVTFNASGKGSARLKRCAGGVDHVLPVRRAVIHGGRKDKDRCGFPFSPEGQRNGQVDDFSNGDFFHRRFAEGKVYGRVELAGLKVRARDLLQVGHQVPRPTRAIFQGRYDNVFFRDQQARVKVTTLGSRHVFRGATRETPHRRGPISPSHRLRRHLRVCVHRVRIVNGGRCSTTRHHVFLLRFVGDLSQRQVSLQRQ